MRATPAQLGAAAAEAIAVARVVVRVKHGAARSGVQLSSDECSTLLEVLRALAAGPEGNAGGEG